MLDTLKRLLPRKAMLLDARLEGVAGFTGAGSFRYALSPGGSCNYEIDARGVAGLRCELFVQGEFVATLDCRDGRVSAKFDSRLDDAAIRLTAGDIIEIRQNGDLIMAGALVA